MAEMASVTLRSIADKVGCSRSTVSYALNNNPTISAELRQRVLQAAEELGWRPDAELARQMALVRGTLTKTHLPKLAVVINKSRQELANEPTPRQHLSGALSYAERMGYSVDLFNLAEEPLSPKRLRNILVARGVQGVVFIATVDPELGKGHLEIGRDFACSIAGVRYPDLPFHVVLNDFLSIGRTGIMKGVELGYLRPAVIIPRGIDEPLGYGFTGGASAGLMEIAPENRLPVLHVGRTESYMPEYEFDRVAHWLLRNRPDVVFTTDVLSCRQVAAELESQRGLSLPIYSYDYYPDLGAMGGLDLRQEHVGRAAVDVVVGQLYRGESGLPDVQRVVQIPGIWTMAKAAGAPLKPGQPRGAHAAPGIA